MFYKWKHNPEREDRRAAGLHKPRAKLTPEQKANRKFNVPKCTLSQEDRQTAKEQILDAYNQDYSLDQYDMVLKVIGESVCSARTLHRIALQEDLPRVGKESAARYRKSKKREKSLLAQSVERYVGRVATGPNQVWVWDISHFKNFEGKTQYLFTVLDIFSRKAVHARFYDNETAENAVDFFKTAFSKEGITPFHELKLHSDNGSAMVSHKLVSFLIDEFHVGLDLSRPYKKNDNAVAESFFGSAKKAYEFDITDCKTLDEANQKLEQFIYSYNYLKPHKGINMSIPGIRHQGQIAEQALFDKINENHQKFYAEHPDRMIGDRKHKFFKPAGPQFLNPSSGQIEEALLVDPDNKVLLAYKAKKELYHISETKDFSE